MNESVIRRNFLWFTAVTGRRVFPMMKQIDYWESTARMQSR